MKLFDPIRDKAAGTMVKAMFIKLAFVRGAIVGFPKCGNTWYSALLRHILIEHYGLHRSQMGRLFVSDLGIWPYSGLPHKVPRLYQTHCLPFEFQSELRGVRESLDVFSRTPMILLIRDHKDVMVSYFMHLVHRISKARFDGDMSAFVRSASFGVTKFVRYYNLVAECRARAAAPTLVRRYEDLWFDPVGALQEDCEFLKIGRVDRALLGRVVEECSLDNMRRMELAATLEMATIPGLFRAENDSPQARKVREGGVGKWRKYISSEDAAEMDAYVAAHLSAFYAATPKAASG